jgi:hypothetical protein
MNFFSSLGQNLFRKIRNLSLQRRKSFKPCHFKIICIKTDADFALCPALVTDDNFRLHIKILFAHPSTLPRQEVRHTHVTTA